MENFPKYFRRLVTGNAPQIFPGINRNIENPANYQILVREVEKVLTDPEHASRIAQAIEGGDGDAFFRDFDLATFIDHFKLNVYGKIILASAFTRASRDEFRSKAVAYLKNSFDELGKALTNRENTNPDTPPVILATSALRYLHGTLPDSLVQQNYQRIKLFLNHRYQMLESDVPSEIQSLFNVMELDGLETGFYDEVLQAGPGMTQSVDSVKSFLSDRTLDEKQVGHVILYMALSPDWQPYRLGHFISGLLETVPQSFNWEHVLDGFDANVSISKVQFLTLYHALEPISRLDLQTLWLHSYKSRTFDLSILASFFACSPSELDASSIPDLRLAFDPEQIAEAEDADEKLQQAYKSDTMISLDAVTSLLELCLPAGEDLTEVKALQVAQAVGDKIGLFLCSATCIEEMTPARQQLISSFIHNYYLKRERSDYSFVLRTVWKHDKKAIAQALIDAHVADPLELTTMLDVALQFGWLDGLLTMSTAFAFDLAALAHRRQLIDFTQWATEKMNTSDVSTFVTALSRFVIIKTQDELRISRDEQPEPRTVTLSIQTAYDMLMILEQNMPDHSELKTMQRTFLQAYPRLILYCEGIRDDIDVDCKKSNAMPRTADAEMQELYKKMYGKELEVPKVIQYLQECKASSDSSKMDLFACMIHGLFDEYTCFSEYPLDPLQKTALLFGGIIKVGLISDLTLRVAREMVLDALANYSPSASMFKFGLQAVSTFAERLSEPGWTDYCTSLIRIPWLRDSQVYPVIADALAQNGVAPNDTNGSDGLTNGTTLRGEGNAFDMMETHFNSISAGPAIDHEEPDEDTKDKIVFFFNNVSQQNLRMKFDQLKKALTGAHYGWFADFLVNGRAKLEQNYQPLYLDIMRLIGSRSLSNEVLSATYHVVRDLFNADATMQSITERKNLKSLAVWLGSLTLAQDKPIKRRNIAFLDLLMEGLQFEKLLLVIPFICNVLAQGRNSAVFRPPNPWVEEILAALVEFYQEVDITTNQKFDIEVLFDELGVDMKSIEPSTLLRERALSIEDQQSTTLAVDGIRSIGNLGLGSINGSVQNSRFEVQAMQFDLGDIEPLLKFPPFNGTATAQQKLQQMVVEAVTHAIYEIIGSVVERSVTIAGIAAKNLIHKDFACEEDSEKVRLAARRVTRELASSLALVTSKDPLRTSMNNFIRRTQLENPDQNFPEGINIMCVNDNIDVACQIVENKAAEQALPEIDAHIEGELSARAQHRTEHPGEPYIGPAHNRWSTIIPEPYKQTPNGLKPEQLAIYEEFGRQPRGPPTHAPSASGDSGRQLPDVLQDNFGATSHTPASADSLPLSQQTSLPQQYQGQRGRMLPPPLRGTAGPTQTNGFVDPALIEERVGDLLSEIVRISLDNDDRPFEYLRTETPLFDLVEQARELSTSHDGVAMNCAENICKSLSGDGHLNALLIEIFVHLLAVLCQTFPNIAKEVAHWADLQSDNKILATDVTLELIKKGIMQLKKVDASIASLIKQRDALAVEALSNIFNDLLFTSRPVALRTDFVRSLGALAHWSAEDSDIPGAKEIWSKLMRNGHEGGMNGVPDESNIIKKHQFNYVFTEWVRLCEQSQMVSYDKIYAAFVSQMHLKRVLHGQEDLSLFLRVSIDVCIMSAEISDQEDRQRHRLQWEQSNKRFVEVDALARLIVQLAWNHRGEANPGMSSRVAYLDNVLSLLVLIINHHQVSRKDQFNQRVFFRLLSGIICDWHDATMDGPLEDDYALIVLAEHLVKLGPRYFPGFVYGWLGLVSHRYLMPSLLKLPNEKGYEAFLSLLETALSYIAQFVQSNTLSPIALDLYRGILRILLVLHRDFPEFLVETHYRLCNAVPAQFTQLLNLILSAYPSFLPELPNPFIAGVKLDRIEELRRAPRIWGDFVSPLTAAKVETALTAALSTGNVKADTVSQLARACHSDESMESNFDSNLLHYIVLFVGHHALTAAGQRSSAFVNDAPPATLLRKLYKELSPQGRFYFISAMVNQLRWPNASTQYFTYMLLDLFGIEASREEDWASQQQILAVLLERINVVLPHPWGLISVMLELLKDPAYRFWQLPFVKSSPQVQALCEDLLKQGEEREQRWPAAPYA